MATPALLLFDVDGTLLGQAAGEHAAALREALHEVHGLDPAARSPLSPAGRTDGEIARGLLLAAGVSAERIDARTADVRAATCAAYARLCPTDLSHTVLPGIATLLDDLAGRAEVRLSLVTGNFEPVGRLKLKRAGIGHHFPAGQGGFGSDSEDRAALPGIARRRAGADGVAFGRERTIVIGDTPRDIACARADGVRCLAVATGPFSVSELQNADGAAADATELEPLIELALANQLRTSFL